MQAKEKLEVFFADELPFKKYIPEFNSLPFGMIIGQVTPRQNT